MKEKQLFVKKTTGLCFPWLEERAVLHQRDAVTYCVSNVQCIHLESTREVC